MLGQHFEGLNSRSLLQLSTEAAKDLIICATSETIVGASAKCQGSFVSQVSVIQKTSVMMIYMLGRQVVFVLHMHGCRIVLKRI